MNELQAFEKHLRENEKSPAAIEKYLRDAHAFLFFAFGRRKGSKNEREPFPLLLSPVRITSKDCFP